MEPEALESPALAPALPEEPNRFIGRERELGCLRDTLHRTRALTLCGAGGIGKTRLALRLLAITAGDFADGVYAVELGDLWEPDLIVSRVAAVIGVEAETGRPLQDTLADALETRQTLIMLDNCEHLVDACAALCQRLLAGCPELRIVATSQEPLRIPQESVWQVAPLAVPPPDAPRDAAQLAGFEAVQLFADRAAAARPGFAISERNAMAVTGHLPRPGRRAAGHRAGRRPGDRAVRRADRRPAGRPLHAAGFRRPDRAAAAADAAGHHRLEP